LNDPDESPVKHALSVAIALFLVLVVAFAALSFLGPMVGWQVNAVLSGSMEPAVHTGDMIITRPVAPGQVTVGEIVLFRPARGGSFVAHRVVEIMHGPTLQFITKGDVNNDADPTPVSTDELAGVLFLRIPYLYYLFTLIRTPLGLLVTIGIPAATLVAFDLRRRKAARDAE